MEPRAGNRAGDRLCSPRAAAPTVQADARPRTRAAARSRAPRPGASVGTPDTQNRAGDPTAGAVRSSSSAARNSEQTAFTTVYANSVAGAARLAACLADADAEAEAEATHPAAAARAAACADSGACAGGAASELAADSGKRAARASRACAFSDSATPDAPKPGWGCGDKNHTHSGPPAQGETKTPC